MSANIYGQTIYFGGGYEENGLNDATAIAVGLHHYVSEDFGISYMTYNGSQMGYSISGTYDLHNEEQYKAEVSMGVQYRNDIKFKPMVGIKNIFKLSKILHGSMDLYISENQYLLIGLNCKIKN